MDNMEYMAKFPDKFFDLAVVDPQTGQGEDKKHATRPKLVKQKNGTLLAHNSTHRIKSWDNKQPEQSYFDELFRVSKHQIIMCENYLQFNQKNSSAGRIVWNMLRVNDFSDAHIMWNSMSKKIDYFEFLWNGMIQGYAINNREQQGNKKLNEKRIHPNQKPKTVYQWLLKKFAQPGFKILDTHLGSGNSRVVAYDMDLDFYGCEKDSDIFNDHEFAFSKHISQQKLFTPQQQVQCQQTFLL